MEGFTHDAFNVYKEFNLSSWKQEKESTLKHRQLQTEFLKDRTKY